jgi:hypothetical protein
LILHAKHHSDIWQAFIKNIDSYRHLLLSGSQAQIIPTGTTMTLPNNTAVVAVVTVTTT